MLRGAGTAFGSFVAIKIIELHHQPPFLTAPYFLALTQVGLLAFAGLIVAVILLRRQTAWHQRLVIGATVMLTQPALGRLLPMPLIQPWGGVAAAIIQLGILGIMVRHDRRTLGAVHPATVTCLLVVGFTHLLIEILARTGPVIDLATRIAA